MVALARTARQVVMAEVEVLVVEMAWAPVQMVVREALEEGLGEAACREAQPDLLAPAVEAGVAVVPV